MSKFIVIFYQFKALIWRAFEDQKSVLTFKLFLGTIKRMSELWLMLSLGTIVFNYSKVF